MMMELGCGNATRSKQKGSLVLKVLALGWHTILDEKWTWRAQYVLGIFNGATAGAAAAQHQQPCK